MKKVLITVIAIVVFILSFILVRYFRVNPHQFYLNSTHLSLVYLRGHIDSYKEETGEYPESLLEMKQYFEGKPDYSYRNPNKEHISSQEGSEQESDILNGEGGWYYDKETGEIAININKPLKDCFGYYYYSNRNEIPSEW